MKHVPDCLDAETSIRYRRVSIESLRSLPWDWFDLKPQLTKTLLAYELQAPSLVHRHTRLGGHAPCDPHDERDPRVNLLLGSGFAWIDIAAPVVPTDHVLKAPVQHRVALVRGPMRAIPEASAPDG